MTITNRNTNRLGGYSLFLFEFQSQEEFDGYLTSLRYCAELLPTTHTETLMLEIANKLEQRCTNRYAHDDVQLTASLFPDEMARFMLVMTGVMWEYEDFNRMVDGIVEELDKEKNKN